MILRNFKVKFLSINYTSSYISLMIGVIVGISWPTAT